jgi:hypothetical protein
MYRSISSQVVENSEGFIFGSNDRWSLMYSDDMGVVTVSISDGSPITTIIPATMRRWKKDMSPVKLTDDEIRVIMGRIAAGWSYYDVTDLRIDSKPTEHAAPAPQGLYWPLYGGERLPIVIP